MKKITFVFFFLFCLLSSSRLWGSGDLSDLRGLTLTNAKIPIYNRSGKPQMMIFVNKADRHGRVISGKGTVIDFLRPNASVDDIKDAWRIKLYPLKASFKEVFDFWLPRVKYSEAIVQTRQADIDQENHKASGSSVIFMRSPLLDLNGVGFEANFKRREIRVNSDIEVLIRTAGNDPRKLDALKEKKYQYITATGDSLLIELEAKRIMLIGNVTIQESQAEVTCDRLTVMLSKDERKTAGGKKKFDFNTSAEVSGISQLLADGHVVVSGKAKNAGKVYADHLIYNLKEKEISFSSDIFPGMQTFRHLKQKARTVSRCKPEDIPGYVIVDNPQMRSFGTKVTIRLGKDGSNVLQTGTLVGTQTASAPASSLQSIIYPDGVFICGKEVKDSRDPSFAVQADYCEYLPGPNVINLRNNVYAHEGGNNISCETAVLKVKQQNRSALLSGGTGLESIHCHQNVRLLHTEKGQLRGNLVSDKADFYPDKNRIIFYDNVNASHNGSKLTCRQLELFLADRKTPVKQPVIKSNTASRANAVSATKVLQKIIASGNVVMTDPKATLNTGQLILNFRELRTGEKPVQSMLQSGNVRLSRIICDNGLKVVSSSSPDAKASSGFFGKSGSQGIKNLTAMRSETDLEKNISSFSGNVKISDAISRLECGTLHLYSAARQPVPAKAPVRKVEDIDSDPFALIKTENYAPSQIIIAENLELKKVECIENVILSRQINEKHIKAGGQRADYDVKSGRIIISGKSPNRAWIEADKTKQTSDKLVYHLAEERFESSGNTETTSL